MAGFRHAATYLRPEARSQTRIVLEPDVGTLGELSTLVGRHPSIDVILAGPESTLPRGSTTELRGEVLLHASNRYGRREQAALAAPREAGLGLEEPSAETRGAIVGRARPVGCREVTEADWSGALSWLREGRRWAWELEGIERLEPVACGGHIFRFDVPKELSSAAAAAPRAGRAPRPARARARGATGQGRKRRRSPPAGR